MLHAVGMCKSVQGFTMADRSLLLSSKHLVLGLLGGLPVAVPLRRALACAVHGRSGPTLRQCDHGQLYQWFD